MRGGQGSDGASRETLGAAVVGCGYWGMNYLRVLHDLPTVRVIAACDQEQGRLDEIRYRYPSVDVTPDVDTLLARDDVDIVMLCVQAGAHREVGLKALGAGKHVLVEKPLATRAADAIDLIEAAESRRLTLMVGHTFLYNPAVVKVKEYVSAGSSGPIFYLYARRTNLGPIRLDVNAVWDLAPHDVSIFNFLLESEPEWVSAVGSRPLGTTREDVGFVTLGYPGNVLGHIHVSWADPNKTREVVVVCEDRRVVFNDLESLERVRVFEKGVTRRETVETESYGEPVFALRDGEIVSPVVEPAEPLRKQCEHFISCVETGALPFTDGRAGLAVVRAMEAMDLSIQRSGSPVPINGHAATSEMEQGVARSIR